MRLLAIIASVLIATIAIVAPVYGASTARYEYYNTGDDSSAQAWGPNWFAQTFTANDSYVLDYVKLCLRKEGTPGTLTMAIYSTNESGWPVDELGSGTYNSEYLGTGNTWPEIHLASELSIADGETYAIVLHTTGASAGNDTAWRFDSSSPTYSGGQQFNSSDAGGSWVNSSTCDFLFECWGETNLDLIEARVYESYIETGDWLVVCSYKNFWTPYYADYDPRYYFDIELIDAAGTIVATDPLRQWGYRPFGLYIKPDAASLLDWGNTSYTIKLNGSNVPSNPYDTYTLTAECWKGDNIDDLDAWCMLLAHSMDDFYNPSTSFITFDSAAKREILSEEAGVYFEWGIPYLSTIRPEMFEVVVISPNISEGNWSMAYLTWGTNWSTVVGPDVSYALNTIATSWFDLPADSGKVIVGIICFIIFVLMAGIGIPKGHHTAGIFLGFPILVVGCVIIHYMVIFVGLLAFMFVMWAFVKLVKTA